MKYTLFILLLITGFISSCGGETKDPPKANVYEVKNIGLLSTSEYTIGKIIKLTDDPEWYKLGDRKLIMSCKAKIKAGVDLKKIKEGDITVVGNTITIVLPPVEITSFTMDPKLTHTEMESVSGLRQGFSQNEKYEYMRQGEAAIRRDMKDTKILKDAEENAAMFLRDFYRRMGYEKVIVKHKKGELENE
ncbi:MAG: DUF4230 domain-containing protein [Flavobacteriales bacterium]|nr:DUF4230 domain-containing protein [Flavobacteriales bacterium]